jgi:hypothetical protein
MLAIKVYFFFAFSKYRVELSGQRECDEQGMHVARMGAKELKNTSLYFTDDTRSLRRLRACVVGGNTTSNLILQKIYTATIVISKLNNRRPTCRKT